METGRLTGPDGTSVPTHTVKVRAGTVLPIGNARRRGDAYRTLELQAALFVDAARWETRGLKSALLDRAATPLQRGHDDLRWA